MNASVYTESGLQKYCSSDRSLLIGRISFEGRSVAVAKALSPLENIDLCYFYSTEETYEASLIRKEFCAIYPSARTHSLCTSDPLEVGQGLWGKVSAALNEQAYERVLVDISCFRREEMLMLLKFVMKLANSKGIAIDFVYSAAREMGEWLSKQVVSVRSVLGFSGELDPRKPTHLVLLQGFENHRSMAIIEAYEPRTISLGFSSIEGAVNSDLHRRNIEIKDYVRRVYDNIETEFEFSATDFTSVVSALSKIKQKYQHCNIVLAPLNTKISTVGVGVFALTCPEVQVCYAQVQQYNSKNYSTFSGEFYVSSIASGFLSQ